jgi:N-methylhydantoinase A
VQSQTYHLGIDIGGTFTDLSLRDPGTGQILGLKTPTIPADPAQGVANGLRLLAEQGIPADRIAYFVHGTTIGVNAIIQRSGAPVALLVTEGFRDVLELARLRLPTPWDFYGQRPRPLIPREHVVPVRERILAGGDVLRALDADEIDRVVAEVAALPVEGVAICLLHAYENPVHELAIRDALAERLPDRFVSCSADVWPQVREYERSLVTAMNAYSRPVMVRYLDALESTLAVAGIATRPYLTRSNGGIMTTTAAKVHPVQTLLSGPASGVIGARSVAAAAGFPDVITFDMGGTSADVAIITGGDVEFSREAVIGEFPVFMPVVGVASIGAGGGSVAWLDSANVLKVGPRSAGADPGPSCYGLGGTEPTLTDAFLLSGFLNPGRFAGKAALDADAARVAMARLAEHSSHLTPDAVPRAVVRVALANMYTEFSAVLEQRGIDPRDYTLLAFGGAGPVLACLLAEEINVRRVLVPPSPGTLCALGALDAEVMSDFIRTVHWRLDEAPGPAVFRAAAELASQGETWLATEAPTVADPTYRWSADMRYVGQSHEIETAVEIDWLLAGEAGPVAARFHDAHRALFNLADPAAPVEMINLRVRAAGSLHEPRARAHEAVARVAAAPIAMRKIDVHGGSHPAAVYERALLASGQVLSGPSIVEQADSTVVVPPGWDATVDAYGNLVIVQGGGR